MRNGIDVSKHNGNIDWQKVKASGIDFAIIRAGYGKLISQKDQKFEDNYAGCKAHGIPCGAYWYSYALTPAEAVAEALTFMKAIEGKKFEYPVWLDIEEKSQFNTGKKNVSSIIRAFCNEMEKSGFWVGVYASRSAVESYIDAETQKRYALWIAEWGNKLNYAGEVGLWQCSDKGKIPGICGAVDLDISYVDYPSAIKRAGKNGYKKPDEPVITKPVYIPGITASDVSVYLSWCSAVGLGTYPDTQEGFDAFLEKQFNQR